MNKADTNIMEEIKKLLEQKNINDADINELLNRAESELNRLSSKRKKYGLVWEDKGEDIAKTLIDRYSLLKERKEKDICLEKNKPTNVLIEGDNLYSLNSLLTIRRNSVNLIYIDPPYNTGNKDFKYNDRFIDKEDTYRHSTWLSFMSKRLKLARELLTDDGVIFISIDDNEVAQLKLLCDEIFGENNLITNMIWVNNLAGRQIDKHIANVNEYVLCYSKNVNFLKFNKYEDFNESILIKYEYEDEISKYAKGSVLYNTNSKFNIETRKNLTYSIYYNPKTKECICRDEKILLNGKYHLPEENLLSDEYIKIIPPIRSTNKKRGCWRWSIDKFNNEYKDEIMILADKKGNYMAYTKDRLSKDGGKIFKYKNLITEISSTVGTSELTNILSDKLFDYPKPTKLIKKLLKMATNKDAVVLDFFAGSGTTGHAVLELNKEDGGNRTFILCTNNENNICEEVTYERLNKVINGYTTPKGKQIEGLGGNLKYYKCELVNKSDNEDINNNIKTKNITEMIKIKTNCYNVLDENENYVIVESKNKVVGIIKKYFLMEDITDELSNVILNYEHKIKEIYTNIELESIDIYKNINYYKIPKDI